MTQARRIEKLEAQVAALRARLDARTDQLLLVLLQIDDLKRELDRAKRSVHPAPESSTC
jgi:chromosome segregation ATPase